MTSEYPVASGAKPGFMMLNDVNLEIIHRGSGRPILFLHPEIGLAPDLPALDLLAERGRVIAPSHPGFTRSSLPGNFSQVDDLAYFYLDLIAELDLRDTLVVGVSFGAWIAAEIAIKSCERISQLVLAAPVGIKIGNRDETDVVDVFSLTASDYEKLAFADPEAAGQNLAEFSDEDVEIVARNREATALFGWLPYMHDPKLRDRLYRIKVPTLVLKGAQDRVISDRYAKSFVELIPGASFLQIDDAGHFPHIEQPDAFVSGIGAFAGT